MSGTLKNTENRATWDCLKSCLDRSIDLMVELGDFCHVWAHKLLDLKSHLENEHLYLAVLGQVNRGKSTVVNALLGEAVLPTAVVPLTTIPTFVTFGPERRVVVSYHDNRPAEQFVAETPQELQFVLNRFIIELANPGNQIGVARVEVFHPSPLLNAGITLIDTPGIGSIFSITRIPHWRFCRNVTPLSLSFRLILQ